MSVRLYWWPEPNFGDRLSSWIVGRLTGREVVHAEPADAELVAVGSVLQQLHATGFSGVVWGSGLIADAFGAPELPDATYAAVRGHLTRRIIGLPPDVPVGDPGLLLGRFAQRTPDPRWDVGVVPHRVDREEPLVAHLARRSERITVIDVTAPVDDVIDRIASCRTVLSSALHGLVAADALRIPNAWLALSDRVIGDGFKFRDHLSCFGFEEARPYRLDETAGLDAIVETVVSRHSRPGIDEVERRLLDAFPLPRA